MPGVRVVDEPRKGLVVARERGRREPARRRCSLYLDADCRAPLHWLERMERRFARQPALLALSGPYRFYDWHWWGRTLIRAYDFTVGAGDACAREVRAARRRGVLRRQLRRARERRSTRSAASTPRSSSTAKTPTSAAGCPRVGDVELSRDCYVYTSARRYQRDGHRARSSGLYVRNFWSEILRHRPSDRRTSTSGKSDREVCRPSFARGAHAIRHADADTGATPATGAAARTARPIPSGRSRPGRRREEAT